MVDHLRDPIVVRSFRHSRLRKAALLFLSGVASAYPRQIARALHTETRVVRGLMHGDGFAYNGQRSLVGLGLVKVVLDAHARKGYAITPLGRAVVAELHSA